MKRTADLFAEAVGVVASEAGGFVPGQGAILRGHDLHTLCRDRRWFELYLLALTGRVFSAAEVELLETLWTYTSYPDPRIWNNRVAALAGSARSSPALALGAAIAVSDAHIYGLGPGLEAYDFLCQHVALDDDALLEVLRSTLKSHRRIAGFGRPVVASDERIAPILERAGRLGLDRGPHLVLALRIEKLLLAGRWRMQMNYAAPVAALCLDLGMTRPQSAAFMSTVFLAGMPPVWLEAATAEVPGSLFPIPVAMICYDGAAPRRWADAEARR